MSLREDVELYTKLSGEDGSQETIATIGAYLRGYEQGETDATLHWIPCSVRMPEEHEWLGTKRFGTTKSDEVYVTFESPNEERFCMHLSFQNGKLSAYDQSIIDAFYKGSRPVAWKPMPEPYKGVTE